VKTAFRNHSTVCRGGPADKNPQKGDDPRQGGEEAEVVVDQSRGVGLIHTRHNPGNAHYTHFRGVPRKCGRARIARVAPKYFSHRLVA